MKKTIVVETTVDRLSVARAEVGKLFNSLGEKSSYRKDVAAAYVLLRNLEAPYEKPVTVADLLGGE